MQASAYLPCRPVHLGCAGAFGDGNWVTSGEDPTGKGESHRQGEVPPVNSPGLGGNKFDDLVQGYLL